MIMTCMAIGSFDVSVCLQICVYEVTKTTMVCISRARTKKIYQMTSRKSKVELYNTCKGLKVQYIVYEGGWCLRSGAKYVIILFYHLWSLLSYMNVLRLRLVALLALSARCKIEMLDFR